MKFILDIHVKGKEAENLAQIYFLKKGYHVFNNVSQQGCIDMVVVNDKNETMKIDVKSDTWSAIMGKKVHKNSRSREQIDMNVQVISYNPDTRKLRFIKHRK